MEKKVVLITGASGLVGWSLTEVLLEQGHSVHALSRQREVDMKPHPGLSWFFWDVSEGVLEPASLDGVTDIVHLAGESIGGGRWTAQRRLKIRDSRVETIRLIFKGLSEMRGHQVRTVVSASATGIYEPDPENFLDENSPVSDGFLGKTCVEWEAAVEQGAQEHGLRAVLLRSGVVLSRQGGMYAQLRSMVRLGLGVIPGTGRQWLPWIHIRDATRAYIHALNAQEMRGAYNMVAPDPVTLGQFMKALAQAVRRRIWFPPLPAFLIRLGMGRMSALLLDSMKVSPGQLQDAGFVFDHPRLAEALDQLEDNA